jgi:hypothetical protein
MQSSGSSSPHPPVRRRSPVRGCAWLALTNVSDLTSVFARRRPRRRGSPVAAVVTLAVVLATSVDAAAPQIDHATTVGAGQTLSDVAATQLPGLLINDAVARIQLVNGLNTSQVHAGQSLLIPAMP